MLIDRPLQVTKTQFQLGGFPESVAKLQNRTPRPEANVLTLRSSRQLTEHAHGIAWPTGEPRKSNGLDSLCDPQKLKSRPFSRRQFERAISAADCQQSLSSRQRRRCLLGLTSRRKSSLNRRRRQCAGRSHPRSYPSTLGWQDFVEKGKPCREKTGFRGEMGGSWRDRQSIS